MADSWWTLQRVTVSLYRNYLLAARTVGLSAISVLPSHCVLAAHVPRSQPKAPACLALSLRYHRLSGGGPLASWS